MGFWLKSACFIITRVNFVNAFIEGDTGMIITIHLEYYDIYVKLCIFILYYNLIKGLCRLCVNPLRTTLFSVPQGPGGGWIPPPLRFF